MTRRQLFRRLAGALGVATVARLVPAEPWDLAHGYNLRAAMRSIYNSCSSGGHTPHGWIVVEYEDGTFDRYGEIP